MKFKRLCSLLVVISLVLGSSAQSALGFSVGEEKEVGETIMVRILRVRCTRTIPSFLVMLIVFLSENADQVVLP